VFHELERIEENGKIWTKLDTWEGKKKGEKGKRTGGGRGKMKKEEQEGGNDHLANAGNDR